MNIKNISITIKPRKEVLKEFAQALQYAKKKLPLKKEELSFENINTLRKVLTEKRMELIHTIKEKHPESIYELAQLLNRDVKSVNTDITTLKELGLLSLEELHDARQRTKPKIDFDAIHIEIPIEKNQPILSTPRRCFSPDSPNPRFPSRCSNNAYFLYSFKILRPKRSSWFH